MALLSGTLAFGVTSSAGARFLRFVRQGLQSRPPFLTNHISFLSHGCSCGMMIDIPELTSGQ